MSAAATSRPSSRTTLTLGSGRAAVPALPAMLSKLRLVLWRRNAQGGFMAIRGDVGALTGLASTALLAADAPRHAQLIHAEDRAAVEAQIASALAARRPYQVEYRLLCADGSVRWVLESGAGLHDAEGRLLSIDALLQDITEPRKAADALREAERRYRSMFENALEGIFQTTPEGRYLTVNPALARMYGYADANALMQELQDISRDLYVDPQRRADFTAIMARDGAVAGFESEIYRRDGATLWIAEHARAVRDADGAILYYEGMVEDITERKRHEAAMRHQALHDALTGLPNRSCLQERVAALAGRAEGREPLALAFIDLDHFKLVNDSLGHAAGDRLLQQVALRLQAGLRKDDLVARLGGDEFVVLLSGCTQTERIEGVLQHLLQSIGRPMMIDGRELSVGCSIGVARMPEDGRDFETLMRCADIAMYRAKADGRNRVRHYSPEMNAHARARLDMLSQLHQATERNEFFLVFEPKNDLRQGRIVGVEALLRWNSASGLVPPAVFIPLAEDTGLIDPIGDWVLRAACAQCKRWLDAGLAAIPISVNLSQRQLMRSDFPERVRQILAETGLPAAYLELEVTESVLMQDLELATAMLKRLSALGIAVSMDDFGTGYSSLSCLRRFPIDCLKIDRSFIRDAVGDADAAAIVKAIISLGRTLGLRVLAEGVETQEQFDFLRAMDCDEFQGWFKTRPLDAERFTALLAAA